MTDKLLETLNALPRAVASGKISADERIVRVLGLAAKRIEDLDAKTWSSISDTLAKKALATAENIIFKLDQGSITKNEAIIALSFIYDTIVGLVSMKNCADILMEIRNDLIYS